jgi:hypothetical protein
MLKTEAIKHFGSAQKLAHACGLKSRQAVYLWPDEVPEKYQYKLHHLTGGALELSPSLSVAPGRDGM